jgi:hypothetical protein
VALTGAATLLLLVGAPARVEAQAPTYATEWLTPGTDPRNRIGLVILGDGYTADAASQAKLHADAAFVLGNLFWVTPFVQLAPLFAVKLVHVVSNQSGATNGSIGGVRDTALSASYGCGGVDRLICVDRTKALQIAAQHFPEYRHVVVVVNDERYGGSGGAGLAVVSVAPSADLIAIHELGHSIGGLADEYFPEAGAVPCDPVADCPEPNATVRSVREQVKWNAWIDPATPVPTPSGAGWSGIGLFLGVRYVMDGQYRPQEAGCLMKQLGARFCAVCGEALVTDLAGTVELVDTAVPATGLVQLTPDQPAGLSLTLAPLGLGPASTRWTVDGQARAATGAALSLPPGALAVGPHEVTAIVSYPTAMVRNDPRSALQRAVTWSVQVATGPAVILAPALPSVPPRGTQALTASGATPPVAFSLAANRSGGTITPGGLYTAGPAGGVTDVARAADAAGLEALLNVTVTAGVSITPATVGVKVQTAQVFAASGGSGTGFAWSLATNGSGASIDGSTGQYTSGPRGGVDDVVLVTDSLGNSATATATVAVTGAPAAIVSGKSRGCSGGSAGALSLLMLALSLARRPCGQTSPATANDASTSERS